jgi:opacity protein-like surface antigen
MKINSMKIGILVCAGLLPLAQNGYSESPDKAKPAAFYLGADYGGFKSRGDEFDDDNDFVDVVAGAFFSSYFGVEGSYTYFGEFGGDAVETTLDGYGIAAIGRLPLTETFALYIKGGYFWWDADIDVAGPLGGEGDVDGEEPFYGIGADFQVSDHVNLAVEYARYEFDLSDSSLPDSIDNYETDIDTVKVGAKFMF